MNTSPQELTIRCGFEFAYDATAWTPAILTVQPRLDPWQRKVREQMTFLPSTSVYVYEDAHGNIVQRFSLPPGRTTIRHDVFIGVPTTTDDHWLIDQPVPVQDVPPQLLRYTLPSRYCDSDRLMTFANQQFGDYADGLPRVQAICDWVHNHIQYRWGSGSPYTTASEILAQGYGVCRDFAHLAVALSRCFNVPTRYVTGYVPDVACWDPGSPMDFHAYMQVYVGHRWYTFDARFNEPRRGRINIACGLDAVDGAFSTLFGPAFLSSFFVWAYQVDPAVVNLGDPIDMSKRLDGTPTLRFSAA
ncbi:MAG: transglutaminase family protein [Chthoniobacter sp.]|uniref:transglutaminase-like domain-containing protein n=1 Tax=Chthoniobacter sp. TaxID=2510640 RepID=UPI0032A3B86D